MATETTVILFKAEVDDAGAVTALKRIEGGVQSVGGAAKDAAGGVGAFGGVLNSGISTLIAYAGAAISVQQTFSLLKSSVTRALDVEAVQRSFSASMGRTLQDAEDFAAGYSHALGVNTFTTEHFLTLFSAMFQTLGKGREDALSMSEAMVKLGGDMSAFYGKDQDDMMQKLMLSLNGQTRSLKQLGMNLDTTAVNAYAFSHGIGQLGDTLTEQQLVLARYGAILEATAASHGALALSLNGATGAVRSFGAAWDELKVSIGQSLLGTDVMQTALKSWKDWALQFAAALGSARDASRETWQNLGRVSPGLIAKNQAAATDLRSQLQSPIYKGSWESYASQYATAMAGTPRGEQVDLLDELTSPNIGAGMGTRQAQLDALNKSLEGQSQRVQDAVKMWLQYHAILLKIGQLQQQQAQQEGIHVKTQAELAAEAASKRAADLLAAQQAAANRIPGEQAGMQEWETAFAQAQKAAAAFGKALDLGQAIPQLDDYIEALKKIGAQYVADTRLSAGNAAASKAQAEVNAKVASLSESLTANVLRETEAWGKLADGQLGLNKIETDTADGWKDLSDKIGTMIDNLKAAANVSPAVIAFLEGIRTKADAAGQTLKNVNDALGQTAEGKNLWEDYFGDRPFTSEDPRVTAHRIVTAQFGAMADAFQSVKSSVASTFGQGIFEALTSGDFTKSWEKVWTSLASLASEKISAGFKALTAPGGTLASALGATGLIDPKTGKFSWEGAGAMAGSMISQYGAAKQDRTASVIGGMVSGAASGAMTGSVVPVIGTTAGAIIGAIVGGLMAYFGSAGPSSIGYHAWINTIKPAGKGTGLTGVDVGGLDTAGEKEKTRELISTYGQYQTALDDLVSKLKQAIPDMSKFSFEVYGGTQDIAGMWQQILSNDLPQAMLKMYKPALQAGLQELGIETGRATQLLGAFDSQTFLDAATALGNFLNAFLTLKDLLKDTSKSLDELKTQVEAGTMDVWQTAFSKTLDNLKGLADGLDKLTSPEQVERAGQIATAVQDGLAAALSQLKAVEDARKSIADTYEGFTSQVAQNAAGKSGGPQAQATLLTQQFLDALSHTTPILGKAAKSPEELAVWMGKAVQYGTQLLDLADQMEEAANQVKSLSADFVTLNADLGKSITDLVAAMAPTTTASLADANAAAVAKIADLRKGLDDLAPTDLITRLGEIRDLTRTTYQNNLAFLQQIVSAQQSVKATFDSFFQSVAEAEAQNSGNPADIGQYYVSQLLALQNALTKATSPDEVNSITSQMSQFAQKLYGLGSNYQIDAGTGKGPQSIMDWLGQFMQSEQNVANNLLDTWKANTGAANDSLLKSIQDLAGILNGKSNGLQDAADTLRQLVTDGLGQAMGQATLLLNQWDVELGTAITTLQGYVTAGLDALGKETADAAGALSKLPPIIDDVGDALGGFAAGLRNFDLNALLGSQNSVGNPAIALRNPAGAVLAVG